MGLTYKKGSKGTPGQVCLQSRGWSQTAGSPQERKRIKENLAQLPRGVNLCVFIERNQ